MNEERSMTKMTNLNKRLLSWILTVTGELLSNIEREWPRTAVSHIPRMKGKGDTSVFHFTLLTHKKMWKRKDARHTIQPTNQPKKLIRN